MYKSILLFDYASILLKYSAGTDLRGQTIGLKTTIVTKQFLEDVDSNIDNYVLLNTTETSASVSWEAFKAYIRGQVVG